MPITLFLASYAGLSGIASCARRGSRSGALQPSGERLLWPCRSARRSARFGPDLELRHTSVGGGRNASLVAKAPTVEVGPAPRVRRPGASVQLGVAGSAAGPSLCYCTHAAHGGAGAPRGSPLRALLSRGPLHLSAPEETLIRVLLRATRACVSAVSTSRAADTQVLWPEPPRDRAGRHGREGREFTSPRGLQRTLPSSSLTRRCPRAEQLPRHPADMRRSFRREQREGAGRSVKLSPS